MNLTSRGKCSAPWHRLSPSSSLFYPTEERKTSLIGQKQPIDRRSPRHFLPSVGPGATKDHADRERHPHIGWHIPERSEGRGLPRFPRPSLRSGTCHPPRRTTSQFSFRQAKNACIWAAYTVSYPANVREFSGWLRRSGYLRSFVMAGCLLDVRLHASQRLGRAMCVCGQQSRLVK